jgi:hypothetical protein
MDPSWRHLNTITIFPTLSCLHTVPTDNLSQSSWVQPPSSSRDHFDPHIGVGSVAGQHTSQGLTYDGPRYVDVTSDVDKRHSVTGAVANPWVPVTVSGRLQPAQAVERSSYYGSDIRFNDVPAELRWKGGILPYISQPTFMPTFDPTGLYRAPAQPLPLSTRAKLSKPAAKTGTGAIESYFAPMVCDLLLLV